MNELQAAYETSRAFQTSHLVDVPAGLFAVVIEGIAYCPVTDATLPKPCRSIVSLHGSRKVAEHIARRLRERADRDEDYEVNFAVFPSLPRPRLSQVLPCEDEVPF